MEKPPHELARASTHGFITKNDPSVACRSSLRLIWFARLLAIGNDVAAEERAEAALDMLEAEQARLHPVICASRASTLAGLGARGRSLTQWAPHLLVPDASCWAQQATAALLRDLVAIGGNMNVMSFSA
ncbi:hypothetical protein [Falsiroseomonas sp.]|uniref:hypothetical protein n=1 Tax=Falsiroseomonas sp. TaxID=2870721 RepID=UPI003F6F0FC2